MQAHFPIEKAPVGAGLTSYADHWTPLEEPTAATFANVETGARSIGKSSLGDERHRAGIIVWRRCIQPGKVRESPKTQSADRELNMSALESKTGADNGADGGGVESMPIAAASPSADFIELPLYRQPRTTLWIQLWIARSSQIAMIEIFDSMLQAKAALPKDGRGWAKDR